VAWSIAGIDTRKLTRILREKGAQNGAPDGRRHRRGKGTGSRRKFPGLKGMDLAVVTTRRPPHRTEASWTGCQRFVSVPAKFKVVAYDFGVKTTSCACWPSAAAK
jgi:carbamoyl-phosphate synthase small subunit